MWRDVNVKELDLSNTSCGYKKEPSHKRQGGKEGGHWHKNTGPRRSHKKDWHVGSEGYAIMQFRNNFAAVEARAIITNLNLIIHPIPPRKWFFPPVNQSARGRSEGPANSALRKYMRQPYGLKFALLKSESESS
ncbi:hypothetical protein DSL72_002109 [Monilinia vaccinii-corymbosi]|uniref:Uncharacterized protein n=1 Tax=Monilinia vaccinii-corymbosi TaxID=61207 RepID=A0A8A3PBQ4_9HELO|nr:hypothetical protein DSL72_002109 [Monilinia vaccinii-corymbosi]